MLTLYFLAELGDKTQLATVALGARYADLALVAFGTTLGMMAAKIPAVLIGEVLAKRFPLSKMRFIAAALFAQFGALILLKVNLSLGLAVSPNPRRGIGDGLPMKPAWDGNYLPLLSTSSRLPPGNRPVIVEALFVGTEDAC